MLLDTLRKTLKRLSEVPLFDLKDKKFNIENLLRSMFGALLVSSVVLLSLSYKIYFSGNSLEKEIKFRISPGSRFTQIADELEKEGIIGSAFYFKLAAKLQNKDTKIISRTYILEPGLNNIELLNILTDPTLNFTVKFTVLEGMTLKQIAKSVEAKLNLDSDAFIKECSNDSLINSIGLEEKVKNLEGFLLPETYKIPVDFSERELVRVLFNQFVEKVIDANQDFKDNPEKMLKAVTLASIVQGETQIDSEMPVIAGVYVNRINKRMRLEADPTVQYILPNGPKQRLLKSDLKTKSPYNTYLNYGLPPGPINNPGLKAIESAMNPASHDYLFFVATGKGGHTFTSTYKEHLKAVEEYKKNVGQ